MAHTLSAEQQHAVSGRYKRYTKATASKPQCTLPRPPDTAAAAAAVLVCFIFSAGFSQS
jgi:hypothetical protein